ncbi:MAG: tetratricopeptide repeat protein [Nitrospinota bacterium]
MPDPAFEPPEGAPSPEDVRAQVEKILLHPEFAASERIQDFLRFIVEETLGGRAEGLKGYTIGVEVFGRDESFDPQIDTIVRVEAGRLRRKLQLYYSEEGQNDLIHIEVPKGSYVPLWRVRPPSESETATAVKRTGWRRPRWAIAAALAVVVILGGAAVWNFYLRVPPPEIEPASVEKMAFALPEKPSVAVLPFENLSGDPKQEYFSDGLTETLITELAKIPGIFVIARNSTFAYKKRPVKIRQVAEELGVQFVLEGGVQKASDRVRITVQLIDALKGHHLWAERYDRPIKDTFAVQDEITRKVIAALKLEMGFRVSAAGATAAEGLEYFFRGLAHIHRVTKEENALARQMFEKVLELEPQWAKAWALLGRTHRVDWLFRWSEDPRQSFKRSAELAEKALALDDTSAGAYSLLGNTYLSKREHGKAIAYGRKSVALAPNSSDVLVSLAQTLNYSGQPEEAVELVKKATRLNPRHPGWYLYYLGQGYRLSGQYDKAIAALKEAVVRHPNLPRPHLWLALAYSQKGEIDKARAEAAKVLQLRPQFSTQSYAQVNPYKNPKDLKHDLEALRKAGLPE